MSTYQIVGIYIVCTSFALKYLLAPISDFLVLNNHFPAPYIEQLIQSSGFFRKALRTFLQFLYIVKTAYGPPRTPRLHGVMDGYWGDWLTFGVSFGLFVSFLWSIEWSQYKKN